MSVASPMNRVPLRVVLRIWSVHPGVEARIRELTGMVDLPEPVWNDDREPCPLDLVISVTVGTEGSEQHEASDMFAQERRIPWLHIACDEHGFLTLGPLFAGSEACPCLACFREMRKAFPQGSDTGSLNTTLLNIAAGLVSMEINSYALPDFKPETRRVRIYDLSTHRMAHCLVARVPGCPNCWPWSKESSPGRGREISQAALFEECSRRGGGLLGGSEKEAKAAARKEKTFAHCLKVQLPPWKKLYEAARRLSAEKASCQEAWRLNITDLANLLFLIFGRFKHSDGIRAHRSLPSSGNLGSAEAYLITQGVEGLPDGMYFYERAAHRLAVLETLAKIGGPEMAKICQIEPAIKNQPGAWLVIVGAYDRIRAKYGVFGFRLIHFDAGIAIEGLREVVASLKLKATALSEYDDELLAKGLLLRPLVEPIMSVVFVGDIDAKESNAGRSLSLGDQAAWGSQGEGEPQFSLSQPPVRTDVPTTALVRNLWEDSRGAKTRKHFTGVPVCEIWPHKTPHEAQPLSAIWGYAITRASERRFADKLVGRLLAEQLLLLVGNEDLGRWGGAGLSLHACLTDQSGTLKTCTLLSYTKSGEVIAQTRVIDEEGMSSMLSDRSFNRVPPMTVWICGDIHCSSQRYRRLLVEAGRLVLRVAWAAEALCLRGVIYGGIEPRAMGRILALQSVHETGLLAFAAGYDASPSASADAR